MMAPASSLKGNQSISPLGPSIKLSNDAARDKMTKYVFSTTATSFAGNPTVVSSNVKEVVENLKKQPGKNIWLYGGANLITTFLNLDLVDEFRVAIAPIILGAGKPLFKDINHRVPLKLVEVKTYESGMIEVIYQRATT